MSTTSSGYFDQSQLALAAYADLSGAASTFLRALQNADMSPLQAANFLGGWQVVNQYTDPITGVSATVFQDTIGKKYLAIRGTESSGTDITADGLLALRTKGTKGVTH